MSTTYAKASAFPELSLGEAEDVVDRLSEDERWEWEAGLRWLHGDSETSRCSNQDQEPASGGTALRQSFFGLPPSLILYLENAVTKAWKAKYLGQSAQTLMDAIDEINSLLVGCNYAKIIAMIQSSGTGKSKTVDEISEKRVVFPLCLGEEIGKNYFVYPPVDTAVRNYLLATHSAGEEVACKPYLRAFLASLFKQALIQTQEFIGNRKRTYTALATMFYNLFSEPPEREDFYKKIVENVIPVDKPTFLHALLPCNRPTQESCLLHIGMDAAHLLFEQRKEDVGSNHT